MIIKYSADCVILYISSGKDHNGVANIIYFISMGFYIFLVIIVALFVVLGIRQINEYERGVRFTMGKFTSIMQPGWRIVLPIFQIYQRVDMRLTVVDVPDQDAITHDNVSVNVNAVLYYKVIDAEPAVIKVQNYSFAVSQLAQTTMRDIVGEVDLDQLLAKREEISRRIREVVDKATDAWGIKIESVDLKHIQLPENMKRTIAKQAEAEREKRSVIITAQGEVAAAENLAKAAEILATHPGALHLRTLQSINDISSDQSNTVVYAIPMEIMRAIEGFIKPK